MLVAVVNGRQAMRTAADQRRHDWRVETVGMDVCVVCTPVQLRVEFQQFAPAYVTSTDPVFRCPFGKC